METVSSKTKNVKTDMLKSHQLAPLKEITNNFCQRNFDIQTPIDAYQNETKTWVKCKQCPQRYTSKTRMTYHIRTVHDKKKPFQCKFCKVSFKFESKLWGHHLKYHSDKDITENIKIKMHEHEQTPTKINKMRSIFHSAELLAISDCKT